DAQVPHASPGSVSDGKVSLREDRDVAGGQGRCGGAKQLDRKYHARKEVSPRAVARTMQAIRLHAPGVDGLRRETIDTPSLQLGEALVEVHAGAITRRELERQIR